MSDLTAFLSRELRYSYHLFMSKLCWFLMHRTHNPEYGMRAMAHVTRLEKIDRERGF